MLDPFEPEEISEKEITDRFQDTLNRCDNEINILVKTIDMIGDTMLSVKDRMSCMEYGALRKTVLTLVAEKLNFYVGELN